MFETDQPTTMQNCNRTKRHKTCAGIYNITYFMKRLKGHMYIILSYILQKKAQAMSEYALILALIAVVVISTVTLLGTTLRDTFQNVVDSFGA